MSFTEISVATERLNRSELAVPASQPRMIEKASKSDADVVFLDLEDAVALDDKISARQNVIEAVNTIDWGKKTISYRINGLDTDLMYRDLIDVVEACGDNLDLIMIPKVGTAADVYAIDMIVTQIESAMGFKNRIGFELLIETALGMKNIHEIAGSSDRNESLHLGAGDLAASLHVRTTQIGGVNNDYAVLSDPDHKGNRQEYVADMWNHALSTLVIAARAHGLRPIDSAYGDFSDPDGYTASAKRAAALGCEGKWAIHPSQIPLANSLMGPDEKQVERARNILVAMEEAAKEGKGAVTFEGRMIDAANIRQAQMLIKKVEQLSS
ncbi:MAG: CoA ester lyase [Pseudomonadota bacterium]